MSEGACRIVLLSPDGRVAAVSGATESWLGKDLDAIDLPEPLREAARVLLRSVDRGPARCASVAVPEGTYELLVAPVLALRLEAVDLGTLLPSVLDVLKRQAEDLDVTLAVAVSPGLPTIVLDAEKIGWAVTTLVGNALRHVRGGSRFRPGGSIDVSARPREGEAAVSIVIEDDGPGIPEDSLPWLFTRAPGAPHSVGLSLALVREVVQAHGGHLDVSSRTGGVDHGTIITLTLPAPALEGGAGTPA